MDCTTLDTTDEYYTEDKAIDDNVIQNKLDHASEFYSPEFIDMVIRMLSKDPW